MKPESPKTHQGPETAHLSEHAFSPEKSVELNNPEVDIDRGAEQFEKRAESSAAVADVGVATTLPTPVIDDQVSDDNNTTATTVDAPLVAGDDDLIEKEWVDKAKKIVAETKNDPYMQEERVNKLQVDYLKKRFGRELGAAD
ncbi:MAG TPA: hypothetical protein PLZ58_01750 [Candidatus Saccharibacteria bacterium]|nr:hypothetical protein [Candidatus Saccharibacteria bacterium]HRQ06962.1 hypothetical protein [Candidatus Saccharibacteria bacterium]